MLLVGRDAARPRRRPRPGRRRRRAPRRRGRAGRAPDRGRARRRRGVARRRAGRASLLRRWPWLLVFAVLPAVPARVPLDARRHRTRSSSCRCTCSPCAAGVQIVLETRAGDRRSRELGPIVAAARGLRPLDRRLAALERRRPRRLVRAPRLLPAVRGDRASGIARLNWSRRAITLPRPSSSSALALLFAGVGVYQYATRNLFWNPKVIVGERLPARSTGSTRSSGIPSIYGRFLMIAIIAALVVVVRGELEADRARAAPPRSPSIWVGLLLSYSQSSFAGLIVAVVLLMAVVWRRAAAARGRVRRARPRLDRHREPEHPERVRQALGRGAQPGDERPRRADLQRRSAIAVRNPVVGVGVGGFRRHYAELTHLKGKEPKKAASHDTPVTVVAESGARRPRRSSPGCWSPRSSRSPARAATRSRGASCSRSALGADRDQRALALLRPLLRGPDDLGAARPRRPRVHRRRRCRGAQSAAR